MKSDASSQVVRNLPLLLTLEIKGLGHVPSFKNRRIAVAAGKMIVLPEVKQRMERITRAFELALRSLCQTEGCGTSTECSLQSWIRSRVPLEDSWDWIPEISIRAVAVKPGEEGAIITIERIN